jgi:hypothetical protein
MPTYPFNPGQQRRLDAPVATLQASTGSLSVHQDPETGLKPFVLEPGEPVDCKLEGGLVLVAGPEGAVVDVSYELPAVPVRAPRGDAGGGNSGGLESRTLAQLRKLAGERKVKGRSSMDKEQLIAVLRGAR